MKKKGLHQSATQGTASLEEIDGRSDQNLKRLTEAGRAWWNEHRNRTRAAEYQRGDHQDVTAKVGSDAGAPGGGADGGD